MAPRWMVLLCEHRDARDPITITSKEIATSLNSVTDFIQFTTENETECEDSFLPTLDFETKVLDNRKIIYKFYSKPTVMSDYDSLDRIQIRIYSYRAFFT